jgi:hypothetical protein
MRLFRRLKIEELEQRVVPVTLVAGVPGSDHFQFTDSDGDVVLVKIGNLIDPASPTSGSVTLLNSDGHDPGTGGNPDIATITFDNATGGRTDLDIDVIAGNGNGSVEVGSIVAPALLRQIRITGDIDTATLRGFNSNVVDETHFGGIITRGVTGDVDHITITGGNLGVASNISFASPEVLFDIVGNLGSLTVIGDIGDGQGVVEIGTDRGGEPVTQSIGDISAASFVRGGIIATTGNLHSLTLSDDFSGATLQADSLGDSATGTGGIDVRSIIGAVSGPTTFNALIDISGNCYANITAVEDITNGPTPATARILIGGDVDAMATISAGGTFANDILTVAGNLFGHVGATLRGNPTFTSDTFTFDLGAGTPSFSLTAGTGTTADILMGGSDTPNMASIEVHGSAVAFSATNVEVASYTDTQLVTNLTLETVVGTATLSHGIPANGTLAFGDIFGTVVVNGDVEGLISTPLGTGSIWGGLIINGDFTGNIFTDNITTTADVVFLRVTGDVFGSDANHLAEITIGGNAGIIDIDGNVGDFARIDVATDLSLLQVGGFFHSTYYDAASDSDVYTLSAGGNIMFAKIDGPISHEIALKLSTVPGLVTSVDVNHVVTQFIDLPDTGGSTTHPGQVFVPGFGWVDVLSDTGLTQATNPGRIEVTDELGNTQILRINNGTAIVTLLPVGTGGPGNANTTANGSLITRIEAQSGTPSFQLYGAEVGHIVGNKTIGGVFLDPALFVRDTTGSGFTQFDFKTKAPAQIYTIESRTGGIGDISSAGGNIVRVLSHGNVGDISAGVPKAIKMQENGIQFLGSTGFDVFSNIVDNVSVGALQMSVGVVGPLTVSVNLFMDGFTGVYVTDGSVGDTLASGDVANYRVAKNTGFIKAAIAPDDIPGGQQTTPTPSPGQGPAPVDPRVPQFGNELIGFFEIDGKVGDMVGRNGIAVDHILIGKSVGDIVATAGDISAAGGITVTGNIRSVNAGMFDHGSHFAAAGNVLADVTSATGNIKEVRGIDILGDISAAKKIGLVRATDLIGRETAPGIVEGSIVAGKLGDVLAKNDIYASITSDSNAGRIMANADNGTKGGIFGDISIAGNVKKISAYEDISGDISVDGNCGVLESTNGSFTGNIDIAGTLKLWEMEQPVGSLPHVEISGTANIGALGSLIAENALITGDIVLGSLKTVFDTFETPTVISATPPFEFLFTDGVPNGHLTILAGSGKTVDRVK